MKINERVKQICTDNFTNFSYVYEDWYNADTAIDRMDLPAIIAVMPVSGSISCHNGKIIDKQSLGIAFVDKVPHDANGDDNATVFESMRSAAGKFIKCINNDDYFTSLDGEQSYQVIYEQLSSIVTGIYLTLDLERMEGCDE